MEENKVELLEPFENDSNAYKVAYFTYCAGQTVLKTPEKMSENEVFFLIKMLLDEIMELGATVAEPDIVKQKMINFINESKDLPKIVSENDVEIIAEQADALVDAYYYSLNAAAKKGINLSSVFDIVHNSNMTKRDPVTRRFEKRSDGKIIKPSTFIEPDICSEIKKQISEGSFL